MRCLLASALVVVAATAAGCGGGANGEGRSSPIQQLVAETDYPVAHYDLTVTLTAGQTDADVRKVAASIADLDGVAVSEADYAGRVIRVALEPAAASPQVSERLGSMPGVASVKSSG